MKSDLEFENLNLSPGERALPRGLGPGPVICWLRQDLRLEDNAALQKAISTGRGVILVFIWAPEEEGEWAPGAASRWWLHHSLTALEQSLVECGSRLVLRTGNSEATLLNLLRETQASAVLWNRRYEPAAIARDTKIKESLRSAGVMAESFSSALLVEPWQIKTKQGTPFLVFTPFSKAVIRNADIPEPTPAPSTLPPPAFWPESLSVADLQLLPKIQWAADFSSLWSPGEQKAKKYLQEFLANAAESYDKDRNRPDLRGTSLLSPALHFGEISPRRVWHEVRLAVQEKPELALGADTFLNEILWREFAHQLLFHFPALPKEPLKTEFAHFPWVDDSKSFAAWKNGETGYPIVDAGLRQLWSLGWMHNRVRMIVASFLVKDLFLPWQEGARWFWDTLVDADLANNTLGWQWTAGCGPDAQPYFRVFNPISQGEKFDPQGDYVRRWIPEIAKLPPPLIHQPWKASASVLRAAGVKLGVHYPQPIVDHAQARENALEAYRNLRAAMRKV